MLDFDLSVVLRLVLAALVGVALGLPRDLADKAIGMRTLGLVSLGAGMITLATLHYPGLKDDPNAVSRVLQGIVQASLETGVPVLSAVLTPHHFHEHAVHQDFFRTHMVTKGQELAEACLSIIENLAAVA